MGSVCSSGSAAGAAGCDRQLCWYAKTDLEEWSFCIALPYFLFVLLSLENQGVRCHHVNQMGPLAEVLRLTVNSGGCSSTQGKDVGVVEVAFEFIFSIPLRYYHDFPSKPTPQVGQIIES